MYPPVKIVYGFYSVHVNLTHTALRFTSNAALLD